MRTIPILSTPSCLGWVVLHVNGNGRSTPAGSRKYCTICSRCVRDFVGFLIRFLLSLMSRLVADGASFFYTTPRSMALNNMCFKLYFCPRPSLTSRATALGRQCVASFHSFTVQTHPTPITLFSRGRRDYGATTTPVCENCTLLSCRTRPPKVRMRSSLAFSSSFENKQPTPFNNPTPD